MQSPGNQQGETHLRLLAIAGKCLAQLSSKGAIQQLMETNAETCSKMLGGIQESCGGGVERGVGIRGVKDTSGSLTQSTHLGLWELKDNQGACMGLP